MIWPELLAGSGLVAAVTLLVRSLPVVLQVVAQLRGQPSTPNGSSGEWRALDSWRTEMSAQIGAMHGILTELARGQGQIIKLVELQLQRGEGADRAIQQIQQLYELNVMEPARQAQAVTRKGRRG